MLFYSLLLFPVGISAHINFCIKLDSFICFRVSYSQQMHVWVFGICKTGCIVHEYAMFAGMLRIKKIACYINYLLFTGRVFHGPTIQQHLD